MKTLNEVAIEGNFLHIEKSIYEKSHLTSYSIVKN